METTRRLSLTLLLMAPLIAAQDIQTADLSLSSVSGEHLPDGNRPPKPQEEEYDDQEEIGTSTTTESGSSTIIGTGSSTTMSTGSSTTIMGNGSSTIMGTGSSTTIMGNGSSTTMGTASSTTIGTASSTTMMGSVSSTTIGGGTSTHHAEEKLRRRRRVDISSAEDMEVAEQVVFRPIFRHRQILADRKLDKEEAVRQQSLGTATGQAYNPSQYNYYYPF